MKIYWSIVAVAAIWFVASAVWHIDASHHIDMIRECDNIVSEIAEGPPQRSCFLGEYERGPHAYWACGDGDKWWPVWGHKER